MVMNVMLRHASSDGGEFHSKEQLEEAGIQLAQGEMEEVKLSEEEVGQQLSEKTVELNFIVGWQVEAT
jgi:hypothetical protein